MSVLYLLDTTTFSDLMREQANVHARLAALGSDDRVAVSVITRGEVLYGIARLPEGKRKRDLADKAARLFRILACENVPPVAGDRYARVKIDQERAGLPLDENDLWIAATALLLNATLVSRDADFSRIEGLPVQNWS